MVTNDDEEEIQRLLALNIDDEDDDFDVEDDDSNDKEIAKLIADDEGICIDKLMAFTNSSHLGQESEGISRHFARRDYHSPFANILLPTSPNPSILTKAETKKSKLQTRLKQQIIFNGNKFKTDKKFLKLFLKLLSSKNFELKDREFNIPDELLQSILNGAKINPGEYFNQMLRGTIFAPSKTKSQEETESTYEKSENLFKTSIKNSNQEQLKKLLNLLLRNGFKKINHDLNDFSGTQCSKAKISEGQLKTDHLGFKLFQNNLWKLILEIRKDIVSKNLEKIQNKASDVSAKSHQPSKKTKSTPSSPPPVVDENSSGCSPFFNFLKIKFFNRTSSTYQVKEGSPSSSPTKPKATSFKSRLLNCFTRSSE